MPAIRGQHHAAAVIAVPFPLDDLKNHLLTRIADGDKPTLDVLKNTYEPHTFPEFELSSFVGAAVEQLRCDDGLIEVAHTYSDDGYVLTPFGRQHMRNTLWRSAQ